MNTLRKIFAIIIILLSFCSQGNAGIWFFFFGKENTEPEPLDVNWRISGNTIEYYYSDGSVRRVNSSSHAGYIKDFTSKEWSEYKKNEQAEKQAREEKESAEIERSWQKHKDDYKKRQELNDKLNAENLLWIMQNEEAAKKGKLKRQEEEEFKNWMAEHRGNNEYIKAIAMIELPEKEQKMKEDLELKTKNDIKARKDAEANRSLRRKVLLPEINLIKDYERVNNEAGSLFKQLRERKDSTTTSPMYREYREKLLLKESMSKKICGKTNVDNDWLAARKKYLLGEWNR